MAASSGQGVTKGAGDSTMTRVMQAVAQVAPANAEIVAGASRDTVDGWRAPRVPPGYDVLVVCQSVDGWELDFFNERTHEFASENMALSLAWPWPIGFVPGAADWKRLGIEVKDLR